MPRNIYEGFAVSANFLFMALALLIAAYGYRWLRSDRKAMKRAIADSPGAERVGSLVVVNGRSPFFAKGHAIDLPREGTIGRSRSCDIRLIHSDLPARAARVSLEPGGVMFSPIRHENLSINGKVYDGPVIVPTGSRIQWGDLTLRLIVDETALEAMGSVTHANVEIAEPPVRRVRRIKAAPPEPAEAPARPAIRPRAAHSARTPRTLTPIADSLKYGSDREKRQDDVDIPLGVDQHDVY